MSEADRLVLASLAGAASRHARSGELTVEELADAAAVDALAIPRRAG